MHVIGIIVEPIILLELGGRGYLTPLGFYVADGVNFQIEIGWYIEFFFLWSTIYMTHWQTLKNLYRITH